MPLWGTCQGTNARRLRPTALADRSWRDDGGATSALEGHGSGTDESSDPQAVGPKWRHSALRRNFTESDLDRAMREAEESMHGLSSIAGMLESPWAAERGRTQFSAAPSNGMA